MQKGRDWRTTGEWHVENQAQASCGQPSPMGLARLSAPPTRGTFLGLAVTSLEGGKDWMGRQVGVRRRDSDRGAAEVSRCQRYFHTSSLLPRALASLHPLVTELPHQGLRPLAVGEQWATGGKGLTEEAGEVDIGVTYSTDCVSGLGPGQVPSPQSGVRRSLPSPGPPLPKILLGMGGGENGIISAIHLTVRSVGPVPCGCGFRPPNGSGGSSPQTVTSSDFF